MLEAFDAADLRGSMHAQAIRRRIRRATGKGVWRSWRGGRLWNNVCWRHCLSGSNCQGQRSQPTSSLDTRLRRISCMNSFHFDASIIRRGAISCTQPWCSRAQSVRCWCGISEEPSESKLAPLQTKLLFNFETNPKRLAGPSCRNSVLPGLAPGYP